MREVPQYCIGWDVGGWNCDRNQSSRDALVILDEEGDLVGLPWRGNLRKTINEAVGARDWLGRLFQLCGAGELPDEANFTLAIDTPLGLPAALSGLVQEKRPAGPIGASATNPYLFRRTERWLFEKGFAPLSPIKDMIGSQATKGMHVLARFAPNCQTCGVWDDGGRFRAIEAYPAAAKKSPRVKGMLERFMDLGNRQQLRPDLDEVPFGDALSDKPSWKPVVRHSDIRDALICAAIGRLFNQDRQFLFQPTPEASKEEGWIFIPTDGLPEEPIPAPMDSE